MYTKEARCSIAGVIILGILLIVTGSIFAGLIGNSYLNNPVTNIPYVAPAMIPWEFGNALYAFACGLTAPQLTLPTFNASSGGHFSNRIYPPQLNVFTELTNPVDVVQPIYKRFQTVINATIATCELYWWHGIGFRQNLFANYIVDAIAGLAIILMVLIPDNSGSKIYYRQILNYGFNPFVAALNIFVTVHIFLLILSITGINLDITQAMFCTLLGFLWACNYGLRVFVNLIGSPDARLTIEAAKNQKTLPLNYLRTAWAIVILGYVGLLLIFYVRLGNYGGNFPVLLQSFSTFTAAPSQLVAGVAIMIPMFDAYWMCIQMWWMTHRAFRRGGAYDNSGSESTKGLDLNAVEWDTHIAPGLTALDQMKILIEYTTFFGVAMAYFNRIATTTTVIG